MRETGTDDCSTLCTGNVLLNIPAIFPVGHTQNVQVLRQSNAVRNAKLSVSHLSEILPLLVKLHHATVAVPVNKHTITMFRRMQVCAYVRMRIIMNVCVRACAYVRVVTFASVCMCVRVRIMCVHARACVSTVCTGM